ncbi:hypothetical protein MKW92_035507 [Papaver armeniacum]|nr:hypothetical protein MKW92_035507 [Papaver armeniacum]
MGLIQYCFLFLVVFHVVFNEPRGAYGTRFGGSISAPTLAPDRAPAPDTAPSPDMTPASAPAPETPLTAGGVCETMVTKAGYKCQEFTVTTKDGYILSLQRVNSPKGNPKTKEPAFLQHGLFMDGASWFLDSPKESLGFILADNNYDVWVGNTRGTRYSRGHTKLNAMLPQYWDYSWDDMAESDLPAYINFVYKQTKKKINYIGHSQLKAAALLSPVAYLSHMLNPMSRAVAKSIAAEFQGAYAMAEVNMKEKNCCLNATSFDKFIANSPQSTSAKNSMHLAQTSNSGKFTKYDYGLLNMVKYGQPTPPPYPLTNIPKNLPLFISYGVNDALADPQDVEHLLSDMQHPKNKLEVQKIPNYGHLDFIIATNANHLIFKPMIAFLKRQK